MKKIIVSMLALVVMTGAAVAQPVRGPEHHPAQHKPAHHKKHHHHHKMAHHKKPVHHNS